jgi:hypothetical protein
MPATFLRHEKVWRDQLRAGSRHFFKLYSGEIKDFAVFFDQR